MITGTPAPCSATCMRMPFVSSVRCAIADTAIRSARGRGKLRELPIRFERNDLALGVDAVDRYEIHRYALVARENVVDGEHVRAFIRTRMGLAHGDGLLAAGDDAIPKAFDGFLAAMTEPG